MASPTNEFVRPALAGRVSRRDAMRLAGALGVALPAARGLGAGGALAQEEVQVAYLTPGLNVPFWKYLSDGIKQQAERTPPPARATRPPPENPAASRQWRAA